MWLYVSTTSHTIKLHVRALLWLVIVNSEETSAVSTLKPITN